MRLVDQSQPFVINENACINLHPLIKVKEKLYSTLLPQKDYEKVIFFGYYLKTRYFIKRELNKVYRSNTNFTYSSSYFPQFEAVLRKQNGSILSSELYEIYIFRS